MRVWWSARIGRIRPATSVGHHNPLLHVASMLHTPPVAKARNGDDRPNHALVSASVRPPIHHARGHPCVTRAGQEDPPKT